MEGVYVFPLPEMAAVDRTVLQVGDRRIEGRIQERAEAKRTYRKAKREGRTASVLGAGAAQPLHDVGREHRPGRAHRHHGGVPADAPLRAGRLRASLSMTLTARYIPGAKEDAAPAPATPPPAPAVGTGWSTATAAVPDAPRITPPSSIPRASP